MSSVGKIARFLAVCCLCTVVSPGEEVRGPGTSEDAGVTMEITKLDVNDSTLTLTYNVRNGTDRDAWVCNDSGRIPFEVFLTSDRETLLIRKRLDVPSTRKWRFEPPAGMYVRMVPGASLAESLRMALPVSPEVQYATDYAGESALPVRHLALEIGYYDEDLPALIHSIFAVVEKAGLTARDIPPNILNTYFKGFRVPGALGGFDQVNKDPYGQGRVYVAYSRQTLTGEKVLRVDVNNVSIPYEGCGERQGNAWVEDPPYGR